MKELINGLIIFMIIPLNLNIEKSMKEQMKDSIFKNKIVVKADAFAAEAHGSIGQVRKYSGEPYIEHPREVAAIVAGALPGDHEAVAAALLHDVVEDTPHTIDDIAAEFGSAIAGLVFEVTDVSRPADGNRKVRKEIDRLHIARASSRGQTIKLADLISNSQSIVAYDPGFAKVYLREKSRLLEVLQEGHPALLERARGILLEGMALLGMEDGPAAGQYSGTNEREGLRP